MVKKHYQKEIKGKKTAKAYLANQPISVKYATEFCREIKGKKIEKMEKKAQDILDHKTFLPLRKYRKKVAHRKGNTESKTKTGRYPKKTMQVFLKLFDLVKANADYKGLDAENLIISHAFASIGFRRMKFQSKGRIAGRRRKSKSTHVEIAVIEGA